MSAGAQSSVKAAGMPRPGIRNRHFCRLLVPSPSTVISAGLVRHTPSMAQRQAGLRIEVPKPGDDKPRIGRVAVITIVGFAIGVIWPRLAGVKLVPSAPTDVGEATPAGGEAPAGSGSGLPP